MSPRSLQLRPLLLPWLLFLVPGMPCLAAEGLLLRGANGAEVTVFGVLEAEPRGLLVKVSADDGLTLVPWRSFDLVFLEEHHPKIFYAFRDTSRTGNSIPLKLGGFEGILSFEEVIINLHHGLERPRYYTLPENVDYLFDDDPNIMRFKQRDQARYLREIRSLRRELQLFLREIFPKEAIIIDDRGNLHRKDRPGLPDTGKGETSLGTILAYLADTRYALSRTGMMYLREVTVFQEDFEALILPIAQSVPNPAFRNTNANHMKMPLLLNESVLAVRHFMEARSFFRSYQYRIGEFYHFVYSIAGDYGVQPEPEIRPRIDTSQFPQLRF